MYPEFKATVPRVRWPTPVGQAKTAPPSRTESERERERAKDSEEKWAAGGRPARYLHVDDPPGRVINGLGRDATHSPACRTPVQLLYETKPFNRRPESRPKCLPLHSFLSVHSFHVEQRIFNCFNCATRPTKKLDGIDEARKDEISHGNNVKIDARLLLLLSFL